MTPDLRLPLDLTEQRMSTADGRGLHAVIAGTGADLVVLEAGLGAGALSWGPVMERLAPHTRVIAYDRAGYGSSDADSRPRDLSRLADDLLGVIEAVEHRRVVLVGHSWGGPIVRLAAARLLRANPAVAERAPDHVPITTGPADPGDPAGPGAPADPGEHLAGVVLVDPSDEHAELYFSQAMRILDAVQGPLLEGLARRGLLRPLLRLQAAELPEPYRSCAADAVSTSRAARAMRSETAHVVRGLRSLRLDPLSLDRVPLTVITGRHAGRGERTVRDQLSAAHAATTRSHRDARYVEAHRSGHLVPFTEPDLIVEEILARLR